MCKNVPNSPFLSLWQICACFMSIFVFRLCFKKFITTNYISLWLGIYLIEGKAIIQVGEPGSAVSLLGHKEQRVRFAVLSASPPARRGWDPGLDLRGRIRWAAHWPAADLGTPKHSLLSSPQLFGNISNKHHVLYYRVTFLPHTVSNLETGRAVLTLSHKTQAFGQSLLIERTSEWMMWSLQYLDTTLQILKSVILQPDNDFRQEF